MMAAMMQTAPIKMPQKPVINEEYKMLVSDEPKKHWMNFVPCFNGVRFKYGKEQGCKSISGNNKASYHLLQMQGSNKIDKAVEVDG